jgi:hypothetical protein
MHSGNLIRPLTIGAILLTVAVTSVAARAQQSPAKEQRSAQETDDQLKIDLYTKFRNNYRTDEAVAYAVAKDYLQRYARDKDQYANYIRDWIALYEKEQRPRQLRNLVYNERNFSEAFKLGKQVMNEEPDHLDSLIALGNAGYLAFRANNESFNPEAISYASRAIQLIENGKTPDDWVPFKGRDDSLAYLYGTVGLLKLKTAPTEALEPLIMTAQLESELKKTPSTYYYLAHAYETGPYAKLSADYQKNFADKEATPASKQALDKVNQVMDRIIDAFARAVAVAGNDPQYATNKAAWLNTLTAFYKFRHDNSDAGLNDMIASILGKPLPAKL